MDLNEAIDAYCAKNTDAIVRLVPAQGALVLGIEGSLGLEQSQNLQALLASIVDAMDSGSRLILDLEKVDYISSTGVGAFSNTLVITRKKNIDFKLRKLSAKVSQIMGTLGLLNFFPVESADA